MHCAERAAKLPCKHCTSIKTNGYVHIFKLLLHWPRGSLHGCIGAVTCSESNIYTQSQFVADAAAIAGTLTQNLALPKEAHAMPVN